MTVLKSILTKYSISDYIDFETQAKDKHEFYNGNIIKMPGAKARHNIISANIITALKNAIRSIDQNYIVLTSDMKIYIENIRTFVYPDALVICENIEYYQDRQDIIINPLLIVEVLSPSTADYDRRTKFDYYRSLPSFQEYVLIYQDSPWVSVYFKDSPEYWHIQDYRNMEDNIIFQSLNCSIDMKEVYEHINFETESL